jgi:hypothetical protein
MIGMHMVVWDRSGFNVYVMQCIYLCFVLSNPNYLPLHTFYLCFRYLLYIVLQIWDSELRSLSFLKSQDTMEIHIGVLNKQIDLSLSCLETDI